MEKPVITDQRYYTNEGIFRKKQYEISKELYIEYLENNYYEISKILKELDGCDHIDDAKNFFNNLKK
jgi:hypothetical protein